MPSPSLINLEALLSPISEESPSGSNCREDPSLSNYYQQVKGARNAARSAERNNLYNDATDEADEHWRTVVGLAPKIITEQSKDLEVASWYSEAMIRRHGFAGLRDAFAIIKSLINEFWDHLYPMPDEDGIETRVSPLAGLNGEGAEGVLLAPIRNTVITQGNSTGPFTYWEYQQAVEIGRIVDMEAREEKSKKLGYSLETIEKAVSESSSDFFVNLRDDLSQAIDHYKAIGTSLDELCGTYDAPPTSNILNILEECLSAVNYIGEAKFPIEIPEEDEQGPSDAPTTAAPSGAPVTSKEAAFRQIQLASDFFKKSDPNSPIPFLLEQALQAEGGQGSQIARQQAFKQLSTISEFFRKTEPHSPVSYVLEKAVKWGNLPLGELVKELIPDNGSLNHFTMLTGVSTEE